MASHKPLFVLIDSHALVHRAYHAYPASLTSSTGEQMNAVFGFTKILLEVLHKFDPEYVVCAFDSKGPTKRHEMYKEYKATRKKPDDELLKQLPRVEQVVKAFNIPIFKVSGYEADDILGTLVNLSNTQNIEKIIVTGDQDLFQLIDPDTSVYMGGSGFARSKLYQKEEVEEKFGFGPEFIVDYKSIRGDTSDNIPGVKGIGEKGATELIQKFGHWDNIFGNVEQVESRSMKEKLIRDKQQSALSHQLATIFKNVPIDFELSNAKLDDYDPLVVKNLFAELGFRSLLEKLPKANGITTKNRAFNSTKEVIFGQNDRNEQKGEQISFFNQNEKKDKNTFQVFSSTDYILVDSQGDFHKLLEKLSVEKKFAFDTETTSTNFMEAKVLGISICFGQKSYFVNLNSDWFSRTEVLKLQKLFGDEKVGKIGHNIKYDVHVLRNKTVKGVSLDIKTKGIYFDTMIAAYVLKGGNGPMGLKALSFNELSFEMNNLEDLWHNEEETGLSVSRKKDEIDKLMKAIKLEDLKNYACADAFATWNLYEKFKTNFELEEKLSKLFYETEMPLVTAILGMEREGITLDVKYLKKLGEELDQKIADCKSKIIKMVGHNFNIDSPKQVGEVLFDEFKLFGGKRTKTGAWQTNESVLRDLSGKHPLIDLLLTNRELSKLRSTYIDSLIKEVNQKTQKIHTSYNQTIALTGRLTSTSPNLQNIPVATEEGMKIRKAFVAEKGQTFISFDVSQQELRILAHLSGEENLVTAYKKDMDVHALTASMVFGVAIEDVTKEQRAKGKTLNFSLMYGISEYGLSNRLKIPKEEAKKLIENYFQVYPKVKLFFDELLTQAKEEERVETMFGRWRETRGLRNSNFKVRSATTREVINFPIQGSAADMMKKYMIETEKYLERSEIAKKIKARMILQIHDELIFEVDESDHNMDLFISDIKDILENSIKIKVPLKVSVNNAKNWGELK